MAVGRRRAREGEGDRSSKKRKSAGPASLADAGISTSEELVKALKGNEDGGVEKITLASLAWTDDGVPVPRKKELLADFVMATFVRETRNDQATEAIIDARYWQLLSNILSSGDVQLPNNTVTILQALGQSVKDERAEEQILSIAEPALSCFSIQGASIEHVTTVLDTWLGVAAKISQPERCFAPLRLLVTKWTEGPQTRRQVSLATSFIDSFCEAFVNVKRSGHRKMLSCLCRLSWVAFALEASTAMIAQAPKGGATAALVLEQTLMRKKHHSEESEEVRSIWTRAALPILKLKDIEALRKILEVILKYKLYPFTPAPEKALEDCTAYAVEQLETTPTASSECLHTIHRLDDRIFTSDIWTRMISKLQSGSQSLLQLLGESMSRRRSLDRMVEILFLAGSAGWTEQMGIAIATQINAEQSDAILTTVMAHAAETGRSLQLATNVVKALNPLQQASLKTMHDDVALPLMQDGDRAADALRLINAITLRADDTLLDHIGQSQSEYLEAIPESVPLQHQMLLTVLERLRRSSDESLLTWLAKFLPLADAAALDITSAYLPMLERTASNEFLTNLSDRILAEVKRSPTGPLAASLRSDAAILELDRYRPRTKQAAKFWPAVEVEATPARTIEEGMRELRQGDYRPLTLLLCNGREPTESLGRVLADLPHSDVALQAIEAVVAGRPTLFRPRELAMTLAIFSDQLSPANYLGIVTALITLVRRRASTLAHLLPQLSLLLCQLVRSLLGPVEARQLTRLCTAITTSKDLQQAMAVHAVPVLQAYIRAITRPCFVNEETRQEVARAMFCMCEAVNIWQRHLLMDFLADDGHRIVFRRLWSSYEAQRYKGE